MSNASAILPMHFLLTSITRIGMSCMLLREGSCRKGRRQTANKEYTTGTFTINRLMQYCVKRFLFSAVCLLPSAIHYLCPVMRTFEDTYRHKGLRKQLVDLLKQ